MSRDRVAWSLGVALAVLALLSAIQIARALPFGYDLLAYWSAGRHLAGGAPLYPTPGDALGQLGQFKYLPLVAVPFVPLGLFPLDTASLVWLAIQVVVATALAVALLADLPLNARPWAAAAYVLFLPLVLEVTLGNINLVSVALMVLAWRMRERRALAAVALALGVGLKFLPAAMLLFYLAAGRWRVVALAAVIGAAALILSAPFLVDPLRDYIILFPRLGDTTWVRSVVERDEPAVLADILWSTAFQRGLSVGAVAGVLALGWASRRRSADQTQLHNVALAISPYLFPFAFVWTTFLVMSLPLFASTLARVLRLAGFARNIRLVGLTLSWLLLESVQLHDLVPMAAHLGGVALLVTIALTRSSRRQGHIAATTSTASA